MTSTRHVHVFLPRRQMIAPSGTTVLPSQSLNLTSANVSIDGDFGAPSSFRSVSKLRHAVHDRQQAGGRALLLLLLRACPIGRDQTSMSPALGLRADWNRYCPRSHGSEPTQDSDRRARIVPSVQRPASRSAPAFDDSPPTSPVLSAPLSSSKRPARAAFFVPSYCFFPLVPCSFATHPAPYGARSGRGLTV